MIELLAGAIPLLPALAALIIALTRLAGWNQGEPGERPTSRLALAAATTSLLLLLLIDLLALSQDHAPGQVVLFPWIESGRFQVLISFTLDAMGLAAATLTALISLVTLAFSVNYMHREEGFQRFFAVLCLFMAAMLLILLAGNAALMFVGWELAGVSSYLLIGYAHDRATATANATRALVTNRFGDAGFMVAIILAHLWLLNLEWPKMADHALWVDNFHVGLIAGGFLLAALAKSAQFPFTAWLHRALEGPTPSSAIFYGALMVHAGVFLLLRLEPVLVQAPLVMGLLVLLGGVTLCYGLLTGLVQSDVKSAFIFSTQAHVGLMFMGCGLGWFDLVFIYMLAHMAWRAHLFLHAPAVMHLVHGPARPLPAWLTRHPLLYTMAMRRFWQDALGEMLIVQPTQALARDMQTFDDRVIDRMVGQAHGGHELTSLGEWEARQLEFGGQPPPVAAWGRGMLGRLLERLAHRLHRFEEQLLLSSGGSGLIRTLHHVSRYLELADQLLGQPRYLLLLIILTFVVIL